jgi:hypothetical protein
MNEKPRSSDCDNIFGTCWIILLVKSLQLVRETAELDFDFDFFCQSFSKFFWIFNFFNTFGVTNLEDFLKLKCIYSTLYQLKVPFVS